MFLKPILMLVLFIAIAALGSNYVGDGLFDFQKKAKAARMVEFNRDLATIMTAYKADDNATLSIAYKVDNNLDGATDSGEAGDELVVWSDIVTELNRDQLLKGDGTPDFGSQELLTEGTNLILVNSSIEISDEICEKINEVLGEAKPEAADMTNASTQASVVLDATNMENGGIEGACIEDSIGNLNTFAFYVQQY
jgi:hypothetical protein